MKTESLSPARAENAQAQARSAQSRKAHDAPADLFAQLMAASTDVQGALEPVATVDPALTDTATGDPASTDEAGQQALLAMAQDGSILNRYLSASNPDTQGLAEPAPTVSAPGSGLSLAAQASTDAALLNPAWNGPATPALSSAGLPASAAPLNAEASATHAPVDPALTQASTEDKTHNAGAPQAANPLDKRPEDLRFEPSAWVSTVAKGRARTLPPAQQLTQAMEAGGLTARPGLEGNPQAWHVAAAVQPGQPFAQNLASAQDAALSAKPLAESGAATGEQRSGQQQSPSGEPGRVILEAPGAVKTANAEASATPTFADSLGEAMGESLESLGAQVSVWAASNTRRASMRLEAGLKEALEVEVTLEGGKAHLAFRTDDPQAREALKAHAQQVLSELLAQSGLSLEGMSVDARDAQQSSGGQGERPNGRPQGLRQALDNVGAAPADATRLQVKTARPGLSVYA
jgi:hypothetical protein